jgi:hypothetical protein
MDRELIESIVDEVTEAQLHPRGKDGKFAAKGSAELKFAHGNFLLRDLKAKAEKIQNGNLRRSALSHIRRIWVHTDDMQKGLEHPTVDADASIDYSQVHRDHAQLVGAVRQFKTEFKGALAGDEE